jgi:hypothetical protein
MSRLGSNLNAIFCDDMKGKLDPSTEYTTATLIPLVRNDSSFKFEDLIAWIFGGSDWIGDSSMESKALTSLNQFITENPSPQGVEVSVMSCNSEECRNKFYSNYCLDLTEEQQESYKQKLCDIILSVV